jgi:hypothetical protein
VLGLALSATGAHDEGLQLVVEATAERARKGALNLQTMWLTCQAQLERKAGRPQQALELLEYAEQELVRSRQETFYLPELLRARGESLRDLGRAEGEAALQEACQEARRTGALGLELRAAVSLADPASLQSTLKRFGPDQDSPELAAARLQGAGAWR